MTARQLEVVLSGLLMTYLNSKHPDQDAEVTRLEDLGLDENGLMLTLGDQEFQLTIQSVG